jgi:hypothetical protein
MGKVLMRKTVFDNKTGYHRAGEIVTVSADVERHYLAHNFAIKAESDKPEPQIVEPNVEAIEIETKVDAVEVETKEQKMIYGHIGHKPKKNAANKN